MTVSGAEDSLIETCAESKRLVAKKSYTTTGFKYGGYELKDGPVWARLESEITFLESEKDPNRYNYKILKEMTLGLTASSFRTLVKTITLDLELQIDDLLEALASCPQLELFNLVIAATTNRHNSDRIGYSSNVREDTIQRKPLRRLGPSRGIYFVYFTVIKRSPFRSCRRKQGMLKFNSKGTESGSSEWQLGKLDGLSKRSVLSLRLSGSVFHTSNSRSGCVIQANQGMV